MLLWSGVQSLIKSISHGHVVSQIDFENGWRVGSSVTCAYGPPARLVECLDNLTAQQASGTGHECYALISHGVRCPWVLLGKRSLDYEISCQMGRYVSYSSHRKSNFMFMRRQHGSEKFHTLGHLMKHTMNPECLFSTAAHKGRHAMKSVLRIFPKITCRSEDQQDQSI